VSQGRLRASLVVAAIVVGSLLVGAAVDHAVMSRRAPRNRPTSGTFNREAAAHRREDMLGRLTTELDLVPAQRSAIDSIMKRTDSAVRLVNAEMQPRLQRLFDSSRGEIDARLDSVQRAKFAARRASRRGRTGP
jgi:Spy/CpxP family protein refolding chaperone